MKRALAFLCLLAASDAAQASSWSDLWLTHDQQGQRLLDSGKPADAAHTFDDPRRRAYAEIKAGQYDDAAKRLDHFADPQSQYNRGNALARSGKLENAIASYDQAIKQTPADSALGRDARHNRELVAEQLKKQQSAQAQSGGQSQSGQDGQSQNSDQNEQQQGSEQNAANGSQQQQDQQSQGSQGVQSQQRQADTQTPQDAQGKSSASEAVKEDQEAANARRDAENAVAQSKKNEKQDTQSKDQNGTKDQNGKPADPIDQPPSEQALALEQWLRQIPDDPSGLLRRKFLIEHLKRERESRQ
jgi:Ca-activated chloride channel family protein